MIGRKLVGRVDDLFHLRRGNVLQRQVVEMPAQSACPFRGDSGHFDIECRLLMHDFVVFQIEEKSREQARFEKGFQWRAEVCLVVVAKDIDIPLRCPGYKDETESAHAFQPHARKAGRQNRIADEKMCLMRLNGAYLLGRCCSMRCACAGKRKGADHHYRAQTMFQHGLRTLS